MWIHIFISAWTIAFLLYRTISLPINCARRVQTCPLQESQWTQKNNELKCGIDEGYVCMRDYSGHLYESCTYNFTVNANKGNCPVLFDCISRRPYLGSVGTYFPCPESVTGCPPRKHKQYSIYQLYKYPRCIESNESRYIDNTSSQRPTTISRNMHGDTEAQIDQHYAAIVIVIVSMVIVFLVIGGISVYYMIIRKGNTHPMRDYGHISTEDTYQMRDFSPIRTEHTCQSRGEEIRVLRSLILGINKAEAGKVKILPFKIDDKIDDKIDVDCIYVQVSMKDECKTTNNSTHEGKTSNKIQEEMFNVHPDKGARYVFLLGEAGYGKTVECQRIANSWCKVWEDGTNTNSKIYTNFEKALKKFDFLFFVRMRDVNKDRINIEDIICDAYRSYHNDVTSECQIMIRDILKDKMRRCLVLLDGLDEWKYNSEIKDQLLHGCIPKYTDMPECTILMSMRSWKFIEVKPLFRWDFDRMITLKGLDKEDIKKLAEKMRRNYYKKENNSDETGEEHSQQENLHARYDKLLDIVSSDTFELKSLLHIPLLAVFFILATFEGIEPGHSQTTFFLSVIEAFIKRSLRTKQIEQPKVDKSDKTITGLLQTYPLVKKYMPQIQELGKLALKSLTSDTSNLAFGEIMLNEQLGEDTVGLFLRIGLVIKTEKSGELREDNMKISFLHKTIQEFFASLNIYYGKDEDKIMDFVQKTVKDVDKALEYSPVLSFIAGLSPHVGCRISKLIKEMTTHDVDIKKYRESYQQQSYQKVFSLYNLQLRCYREVRGSQYITESEVKDQYSFSDVILLSSDTDIPTIRESAEVLKHHANDIVSLNMVCIPDNEEEGISNAEVKNFLDKSQSIESLYIDGYVNAKCRLFNEYSQRMSRLKTLGLRNVAFKGNILADLITKEESIGRICALGLLYIKSAEDEEIDFEYRIPSIHWRQTTELGFKRKAFPKDSDESSDSLRKQRAPFLRKILEILPKYNVLKILHITYMETDDEREMLLQVLPELHQLESIGYSGSSIFPKSTCNHQYDAEVCSKIIQLENVVEVDLRYISLTTYGLNFENMPKLEEISLEVFTMSSADHWATFFKSVSNIENLESVKLYDTNVREDVLNEYKRKLQISIQSSWNN